MTRNLIYSDTIADFRGILASPGAILLEGNEVIASGTPQEIGATNDVPLKVDGLVIPPFANVHTHLDLSGVGPKPAEDSFVSWVETIVTPIRKTSSLEDVFTATNRGIDLSILGGSAMIGDIASTIDVANQVHQSVLRGISFVEVFGMGERQELAIEAMNAIPVSHGISPHAPYSCGVDVYRAAIASGKPLATHLAETLEELESAMHGVGEFVTLAKKIGVWNEQVEQWADHPVDVLLKILGEQSMIAVHMNYIEDTHLALLANTNVTVAYCPRASAYFGHTNHRFQEMLAHGISVALGTDSLICLNTPDRISVLDEMRFLYKEGCKEPSTLLTMATVNGAKALGEDPSLLTLEKGPIAGLLAIETRDGCAFEAAMSASTPPKWITPLLA